MRYPMTKSAAVVILAVPIFFAYSGTFALWSDASTVNGVTINVDGGDVGDQAEERSVSDDGRDV